jgi:foldase protein PrsA
MRNAKRLWGAIGLQAVCIIVLLTLLLLRSDPKPDAPQQPANPQQTPGADQTKAVAKIEGRTITEADLQEELAQRYGAELLNQMLDREAIRLEANELGIAVESGEIDKELKRMQQGYESEQQFYDSMKEQLGMTKEQIREDTLYKLLLERIATRNIQITDDQIDEYIRTHPEEFKKDVELHIAQIITANKDQANKVVAELDKGEDFAVLARDRSLDDATANSGGDLGWVQEDDPFVPAPIMKAVKQLKPGEYGGPIPLENNRYAVVMLKERKEKQGPDPKTVRDSVRKQLALSEAPPLKDVVKKLREKHGAVILNPAFQK